jgi:hypothetical protein
MIWFGRIFVDFVEVAEMDYGGRSGGNAHDKSFDFNYLGTNYCTWKVGDCR